VKTAVLFGEVLGQVVVKHRKRLSRTQGDVAKALNLSQGSFSRLERGRSSFNTIQMRLMAKALKTNVSVLFTEAELGVEALSQRGVKVLEEEPAKTEKAKWVWAAPREVEAAVATVSVAVPAQRDSGYSHMHKEQEREKVHVGLRNT
jgi:transcriptional regulator with XRE-family HTH domain